MPSRRQCRWPGMPSESRRASRPSAGQRFPPDRRNREPEVSSCPPAIACMYSDTLLALERAHLLQIITWGGTSILVGAALLAFLAFQRSRSVLLRSFAFQCAAWGIAEVVLAGIRLRGLSHRDGTAAATLDRLLWLNTGLDVGYVIVGATLALTGWVIGRRQGPMGA